MNAAEASGWRSSRAWDMARCSLHWLILMGVLGALSGCVLSERLKLAAARHQDASSAVTHGHQEFSGAITDPELRRAAQQVDKPWIAGRAQPLARELSLPPALRADVQTTLLFADGTDDLRRIARRIAAVTGIPVRVRPDALLPDSHFLPRLSGQAGHPPQASAETEQPFDLAPGPAPLPQILDRLAAYRGIRWRHGPEGIEFFRTETRVFNVQALTLDAKAQASLGLGRSQTEGGFVSASSTRLSGNDHDVMKVIRARIEPFLSRSGVLVAEPGASSSVVVTDTPEVLAQIGRYLERENRALTRRVRLVFEELTVALSERAHASLDWNLVFSGARLAAGLAMPALATGPAGELAMGVTRGPMSGSEAVIRALGESVRLVRRSSVPALTLSRRPITHAVRTTFSYIDRVWSLTLKICSVTISSVPAV